MRRTEAHEWEKRERARIERTIGQKVERAQCQISETIDSRGASSQARRARTARRHVRNRSAHSTRPRKDLGNIIITAVTQPEKVGTVRQRRDGSGQYVRRTEAHEWEERERARIEKTIGQKVAGPGSGGARAALAARASTSKLGLSRTSFSLSLRIWHLGLWIQKRKS